MYSGHDKDYTFANEYPRLEIFKGFHMLWTIDNRKPYAEFN